MFQDSSDYSSNFDSDDSFDNSHVNQVVFDKFMHPEVFEPSDNVTSLKEKYPDRFQNQQGIAQRVVHGVSVAAGKFLLDTIYSFVQRRASMDGFNS